MSLRLVADIGGTNARLALSQAGTLTAGSVKRYANADWRSLDAVIADYLQGQRGAVPVEMVLAVAGPVHAGGARLTNRGWSINAEILAQRFACHHVHLLNDLTALGYAVPHLRAEQLGKVSAGAARGACRGQSLVVGIGTGFNVSPVLQIAGHVLCPAAEAGHLAMPSSVVDGLSTTGINPTQFPTIETLFSGRGLTAFCQIMVGNQGLQGAAAIEAYGATGADQTTTAIDRYAALLGELLQELSLAYMPSSGIYLAGSVARALMAKSPGRCVDVFRSPCGINQTDTTAIWTIDDDASALLGCARFAFS